MKAAVIILFGIYLGGVMATYIPLEGTWHMMDCPEEGNLQYFLLLGKGDAIFARESWQEEDEIKVYGNGSVIFESVKVEYEGTHLCVMDKGQGFITAQQLPMRVRSLPPSDLWGEVYESMFVTGLIAALVIATIFALGCFVYKKRWTPPSEDGKPVLSYENPAMASDDDAESGSTHM